MDFIIRPFNPCFFAMMFIFAAILAVVSLILRGKSERTKQIVLSVAVWGTLAYFFLYKYHISVDADYSRITEEAGKGAFTWFAELPLQLCNINLVLIPVAVLTKKRPLLGFCFFMAPLGALLALSMPAIGFEGYSLFIPRIYGYYITHFVVFFGGIAIATFGFFKPKFSDVIPTMLSVSCVGAVIYLINAFFRLTGLYEYSNYFYLVVTEGNPLLEIFHKLIPIPFVYIIPAAVVILLPYLLIVTGVFSIFSKEKASAPVEEATVKV